MQNFKNKVAVVTGAASGLGTALAIKATGLGMKVVIADVDEQGLQSVAEAILASGAECLAVPTDVADGDAVKALADISFAHFNQVDVLFNNAGVLISGPVWEHSEEDWRWLLNINLMGAISGIRHFVPRMIAQQSEGHVVNTSSMAGLLASPLMAPYTVSKQAIVALTETLHYDLQIAESKISTSVLCPGPIATQIANSGKGRAVESDLNPANQQFKSFLKQGIDAGMSAEQAADIVFSAIAKQQFWIYTDAGFTDYYSRRAASVCDQTNPIYEPYISD